MSNNASTPQQKPWTVLVYMVADDPKGGEFLDQQANRELDRIIHAALGVDEAKMHVAVQLDFRSQRDVWRRVVGKGAFRQPETNAADPDTLYGFFKWVSRNCPADQYFLIFWGHSSGPFGLFRDSDPWTYVAQTLTLPELRTALLDATKCIGHPLDIVAFKDCFMSTLETAHELKDAARYLIASEALVPIEGWPYVEMFKAIADYDDPKRAAMGILNALEGHYSVEKNRAPYAEVPYALLDTSSIPAVSGAVESMVDSLLGLKANGNRRKARQRLAKVSRRKGGDPALLDVSMLCRNLRTVPGLQAAARGLDVSIFGAGNNGQPKLVIDHYPKRQNGSRVFGGVSLFCYPPGVRDRRASLVAGLASRKVYEGLQLSSDSHWNRIALDAMPPDPPFSARKQYSSEGIPELARQLLPLLALEQLQAHGLVEQLEREAADMARRTISSLVAPSAFADEKEQGFASDEKEQGFASDEKEQGFASDEKEQGFFAGEGPANVRKSRPAKRVQKARKGDRTGKARVLKLPLVSSHENGTRRRRPRIKEKHVQRARHGVRPPTYASVVKSA